MSRRLVIISGLLVLLAAPLFAGQKGVFRSEPDGLWEVVYFSVYLLFNNVLINRAIDLEELPYSAVLTYIFQRLYPDHYVYKFWSPTVLAGYDPLTINISLFLAKLVGFNLLKSVVLTSLTNVEIEFFVTLVINLFFIDTDSLSLDCTILKNLLVSFVAAIMIIIVPYAKIQRIKNIFTLNHLINELIYLLFIVQFSLAFLILEYFHLHQFFVSWFVFYLFDKPRLAILVYWIMFAVVILLTLIVIVLLFSNSKTANDKDLSLLNYRRKVWHFMIFFILAPVLKNPQNCEFVKIVLAFLIAVFLIIELVRYLDINFVGKIINEIFNNFKDFRDVKGPIIISYIYLLIGVSLPIFLKNSSIGLVALGVGDSIASIIGKKFGKIKWLDSKKTVLGTVAFTVVCYAIVLKLKHLGFLEYAGKSNTCLFLTCLFGGLFEALSDLNDNILIPCVMMIAMEVF